MVVPNGIPRHERVAQIIALLEGFRQQSLTTREIAKHLAISQSYANSLLNEMADSGHINRQQVEVDSPIGYMYRWGAK